MLGGVHIHPGTHGSRGLQVGHPHCSRPVAIPVHPYEHPSFLWRNSSVVIMSFWVSCPLAAGGHCTYCWGRGASSRTWSLVSFRWTRREMEFRCSCLRTLWRPLAPSCSADVLEQLWVCSLLEPGFLALWVLPYNFLIKVFFFFLLKLRRSFL